MSLQPQRRPASSEVIRLFEPENSEIGTRNSERSSGQGPSLSPAMSLREFYRQFYKPVCLLARGAAARNVKQYDESVDYWADFTADPPLESIDDYTIATYLTRLRDLPGKKKGSKIADNTVRKHCVHLQVVLDRCGPRSRQNPDAQRLLEEVPFLPKPRLVVRDVEDNFSVDELSLILKFCHVPTAPRQLSPAARETWWRSLFIFDYNVGLRIGTLVLDLRWSMIKPDRIEIPRTKGGQPKRFPLNRFALDALAQIRPISGEAPKFPDCPVWPWPHHGSLGWLQEQRRMLLAVAGIAPDRRFGFHGLRKAMCTELAEINPAAATMAAGHANSATTQKHYLNKSVLANASAKLPQPVGPEVKGPQMRLF